MGNFAQYFLCLGRFLFIIVQNQILTYIVQTICTLRQNASGEKKK